MKVYLAFYYIGPLDVVPAMFKVDPRISVPIIQ